MSENKKVDKTELTKKPIWYLYLLANILVLFACVITWILISKSDSVDLTLLYLPTLICNLLSMVCVGIFAYFEVKDFAPKIMHFQRKWLNWYIAAFAVYVAAILFNVLFYLFCIGQNSAKSETWQLAIYLSITGVLTLVSIGLQRYARFRIDLDVYRRKHGEDPNKEQDKKPEEKDNNPKPLDKDKKSLKDKNNKSGATGGLLDQM